MSDISSWQAIYQQVQEEFKCECTDRRYVKKTKSNGSIEVRSQCQRCGDAIAVKRASLSPTVDINALPESSDDAKKARSEKMNARRTELASDSQSKKDAEFWSIYSEYMQSDQWKSRRRAVFERDKHVCQACLIRKAEQVHHLTYQHVFNEPLFDLISVCKLCHDDITEQDSSKRSR